ncbi:MAG TPA: FAD-binding oxidoreductase [Candidatus Binataceae bacterium]|nr:FAD-binding oxidoreductase [Candidatus Binataceae bacterium]
MPEELSAANVVVVGAGVVGCSIAFHLAQAGARVSVFDKGAICAGMSARSGALVRMHYTFKPEAELAWKSLGYFENWGDVVGGSCGFVRTGFALIVAEKNADRLRRNVAMLKSIGVETEAIERGELKRLEPAAFVDDVALAAHEPRSGYADPVATTESFAAAARARGAEFNLNMPISALAHVGGRCVGATDASGKTHEADFVCLAAGPWTDDLLLPFGTRIGIKPERAQIAFFRRPPALVHGICIDTITGSYLRPHGSDLTLVGLGALDPEEEASPDSFRETNDLSFIELARQRLAKRVPALAQASYARGHAGIYDVSPDSRAVLGQVPGVTGLFVAAGFSGTGFKTSPAVGAAMAELILRAKSGAIDLSPFSFERLTSGQLIRPADEYTLGADFGHSL